MEVQPTKATKGADMKEEDEAALIGQLAADSALMLATVAALMETLPPAFQQRLVAKLFLAGASTREAVPAAGRDAFDQRMSHYRHMVEQHPDPDGAH